MKISFLMLMVLSLFLFPNGIHKSLASRPSVVSIGSILRLNSTTGGVSDVAIHAAVDDINSDPTVLNGTTLRVDTRDTNCDDGFLGMVQALQFMETDVIAIIGPQCSPIAHIISYVANELQVPLMSFASDATLSSIQFPYFMRTMPSDLYQMAAVAAVIDYYQWKIVTAIYVDDDYGRNGIAALDDELTARRCKISYKAGFRSNAKKSELLNLLVTVSNMESRVIILHTGSEPGLKLLSIANSLNMMGNGFVWIATDWLSAYLDANSSVPAETINGMQGVLTVRPHTLKSKMKSNLVSRWSSLSKKYNHSDLRISAYGFYVYDSVWTVARALDAFFDDGGRISFTNDSRHFKGFPLQVDLSTAILTLSENGELQRIHDKWLKTGDCSTDNTEFVDSNQLRLESFMGLFLICGAACVLALLIYFGIMLRQYLRHEQPGSAISVDAGSSTSKRSLRKFISFVDDRQPPPKKRRTMSLSRSSMPTTPMSNRPGTDIDIES
ncbi:unnamed protein product [Miscanthus lutarioriparius]|uniref:Receptor ligand binding region domain-containing protein n=1 Tax=Miscanthus lutarioriparius TaxID=422564 RepID=A0A811PWL4_9POAL|nr:unnamed protein product [Miscanthus lutarioriparius]